MRFNADTSFGNVDISKDVGMAQYAIHEGWIYRCFMESFVRQRGQERVNVFPNAEHIFSFCLIGNVAYIVVLGDQEYVLMRGTIGSDEEPTFILSKEHLFRVASDGEHLYYVNDREWGLITQQGTIKIMDKEGDDDRFYLSVPAAVHGKLYHTTKIGDDRFSLLVSGSLEDTNVTDLLCNVDNRYQICSICVDSEDNIYFTSLNRYGRYQSVYKLELTEDGCEEIEMDDYDLCIQDGDGVAFVDRNGWLLREDSGAMTKAAR